MDKESAIYLEEFRWLVERKGGARDFLNDPENGKVRDCQQRVAAMDRIYELELEVIRLGKRVLDGETTEAQAQGS